MRLSLVDREVLLAEVIERVQVSGRLVVFGPLTERPEEFGEGLFEHLLEQGLKAARFPFLQHSPSEYTSVLRSLLTQLGLSPDGIYSTGRPHPPVISISQKQSIAQATRAEELEVEKTHQTVNVSLPAGLPSDDALEGFCNTLDALGDVDIWIVLHGIADHRPSQVVQDSLRGALWMKRLLSPRLRVVWCMETDKKPRWCPKAEECVPLGPLDRQETVEWLASPPWEWTAERATTVFDTLDAKQTGRLSYGVLREYLDQLCFAEELWRTQ
jgi:hypothetical protein